MMMKTMMMIMSTKKIRKGQLGQDTGGPPQSPAPYKPPKPDWAVDFRIDDEDGTAWAEADDGTWYYWDNGISDWSEWAD